MPYVVNGIGTWYYGKRRIHRFNDKCTACNRIGELSSYDTTLYFVVVFVPILPLAKKRVLEQCPYCRRHRVLSLKKWEAAKAADIENLLEKLRANPEDRDTIVSALGLATAYQDQGLFDKLADSLAAHRRDDPKIQRMLGAASSYFGRHEEAVTAYQAALAAEDSPEARHGMAVVLLKLGRHADAHACLRYILDESRVDDAGMIYLLVEGYQAEGMHKEALLLIDERDVKFSELAKLKEYRKQRKTSERYEQSGKKIKSAWLTESGRTGYSEGGGTARLARWLGPIVVLALLCLYLGTAFWKGQARRIYLVNGWDQPYTVAVNGRELALAPGRATPIEVAEGDVEVESRDPKVPLPPAHFRIETAFWNRPFQGHTFAINPDELAFLELVEIEYAEVPRPGAGSGRTVSGKTMHAADGIDFEFVPFPASLKLNKGQRIKKTRIGVVPIASPEDRLNLASGLPDLADQTAYARRLLELDPANQLFLFWLVSLLGEKEGIEYLETGLAARPLRVEWHRAYQSVVQSASPQIDLRPRYRKLAVELKGDPEALYLLARVSDIEETDQILNQAAAGRPSAYVQHSLSFQALSEARFAEAAELARKAIELAPGNLGMRENYHVALLAAGKYDRLLEDIQAVPAAPGSLRAIQKIIERSRVYAARGDKDKVRAACEEMYRAIPSDKPGSIPDNVRRSTEMTLCLAKHDAATYLKLLADLPNSNGFGPAVLRGKIQAASGFVESPSDTDPVSHRGLLYLAARKAGDTKLAEAQWPRLLASLEKLDHNGRRLVRMLSAKEAFDANVVKRLPIEPKQKRVLLAVVARQYPDRGKELLDLARKLDFEADVDSLCLRQVVN